MKEYILPLKNRVVLLLILFFLCIGGFHPFISGVVSLLLSAYIIKTAFLKKEIRLNINIYSVSVAVLSLSYLISVFWAVDKLSALFGFVKFLPLVLFIVCGMQQEAEPFKKDTVSVIPKLGVIMTAVSAVLMQIPALSEYFSVSGRLAGFFEYPNTFAVFLLVGIVISAFNESKLYIKIPEIAVLLFGIVYSGSRTVLILTVPVLLFLLIKGKNKKLTVILSLIFVALLVFAGLYAVIKNDFSSLGRFTKISFKESTFLGRLLYYKDGIILALKNPFGLGYLGYYYKQQSVQTGVYLVSYVHNDWLQIMLDVGVLPFALFAFSVIKFLFSKGENLLYKAIVIILSVHSFFDFNFQFVAVFAFFVLLLPYHSGRSVILKKQGITASVLAVLCVFSAYISTIGLFNFLQKNSLAQKISFLENTEANMMLLAVEKDTAKAEKIADKIIAGNKYIPSAYNTKAIAAYSAGDIANMINYKESALDCEPYNIDSYNEYAYMLLVGRDLYLRNNDTESAAYCEEYIKKLKDRLEVLESKTDKIAFLIKDKPSFKLNDDIEAQINEIK